jgi:hypothetical protein
MELQKGSAGVPRFTEARVVASRTLNTKALSEGPWDISATTPKPPKGLVTFNAAEERCTVVSRAEEVGCREGGGGTEGIEIKGEARATRWVRRVAS